VTEQLGLDLAAVSAPRRDDQHSVALTVSADVVDGQRWRALIGEPDLSARYTAHSIALYMREQLDTDVFGLASRNPAGCGCCPGWPKPAPT
jgi:hypothetical protein